MTNSENDPHGEKIIQRIMELLSDERITQEILEPLEKAIKDFQLEIETPISYQDLNKVIAEFIRHLFLESQIIPPVRPPFF